MSDPRLLSLADVRERLGIGDTLLRDLIRCGDLPTVRLGDRRLVTVGDLEALIERRREPAGVGGG